MNPLEPKVIPLGLWIVLVIIIMILLSPSGGRDSGAREVHIVGAGPITLLSEADAPKGFRYRLGTRAAETVETTARKIERTLSARPRVALFAFDVQSLPADSEGQGAARAVIAEIMKKAAASDRPVYVLLFVTAPDASLEEITLATRMNVWMTEHACEHVTCIDAPVGAPDVGALRDALAESIRSALTGVREGPVRPIGTPRS